MYWLPVQFALGQYFTGTFLNSLKKYQKVKFYAIKPNCAFNSCSFLKGKET